MKNFSRCILTLLFALSGALFCPQTIAQHTSVTCTSRSGTVANAGAVVINISTCDPYFVTIPGFGFGTGTPSYTGVYRAVGVLPVHGAALLSMTGASSFLTYTHNGNAATSDFFDIEDADNLYVRINITITPPTSPIVVSPASVSLRAGLAFSQQLSATSGSAPYSYSISAGALPPGLSMTPQGLITGTPTIRSAFNFSVRAQDSTSAFTVKTYSGSIANPIFAASPSPLTLLQGVAASMQLNGGGGTAPYTFPADVSVVLPPGLSLSTSGLLTGTPTTSGTTNANILVNDSTTDPACPGCDFFGFVNLPMTVTAALPTVSIAVATGSVSEDGAANLVFTVTRSVALASATTANITTSGTASSGTDYTGGVATVVIPAGATTATITINPSADGTVEADETVILTVAAGSGYTVGTPSSATGTILNDDVPSASISVSPGSVAEDGAANLVYTVTLNQASFSNTSVNFTVSGTAASGTDYPTLTSPLVIPAGNTTGTITVNPIADATIEANETVIITLGAGSGYTVGAPNNATGTILNDDLPNLTINDVTANEGNAGITNFAFTVSLSAPAGPGGVTFDIATANGTATAGVDYVANSLTGQIIPAGSSTYAFTVQVNGDALNEPSETIFVNVTNVTNATVVDGQGVLTIVNDDPLPSLSINDVTVTEGNAGTVNATFTVTLNAASGQTVGVSYVTGDGTATAPTDYTATSGTLNFTPGQTSRTITVLVSGDTTPEGNETFFVNLTSPTNAAISDNQGLGTITNDDVPVTVNPTTIPNATLAASYSQTLTASGGVSPYGLSVTAGALPAGLTLTSAGALGGTPTAGGTFNFTVTAADSSGFPGPYQGSIAYTLVVNAPTISLPATTLSGGTKSTAYSASITPAFGGTAAYAYAVTAGALPGGLTLNAANGAITGTPSAIGTFNFSVTATDSSTGTGPYTATRAYSIVIIDIAPAANASTITRAYNAPATAVTLNITGGAAASVAIGTAPLRGTAIVSGIGISYQPTVGYAGADSFTYTATNSGGTSAPATVSITVNDPVITITAAGALSATVATAISRTFTFNGGAQPWTGFQVTNLPAGLSITGTTVNSVTISGTPTQAGSFSLTVSATDSSTGNGPYTPSQVFTLTVAAPTLSLAPAAATSNATYGAAYSQAYTASGGIGPYTYAHTGTLPTGLSFTANTLSGTPTAPGSYSFTVTATDTGATGTGAPFTVANNYIINVAAPTIVVNPTTLPGVTVTNAYPQTLTASGGVAPYSFAITSGALPNGLSLSTAGALTGNTSAAATFNLTVTATDANGQTGSRAYTVVVALQTQTVTFAPTATVTFGVAPFTVNASATSGLTTFTFSSTTTGVCTVAGDVVTIVAAGTCSLTAAQAGDALFAAASSNASINVLAIQPAITVTSNAALPLVYNATTTLGITGGNGTGAVTYASNNSNCTIVGTTLTAAIVGTCNITATKAADGTFAQASSAALTIAINKAPQATLTTTAITPLLFNGTTALGSAGGSGVGSVSWASSDTTKCQIVGNVLTAAGVGTCDITATKTTDANYLVATSVALTITVNKAPQTPALTATAASTTVGFSGTTTLGTTGGAGTGTVSYSSSNANCAIVGNILTANAAAGTCDVTATKLTDANYLQAVSANLLTITLAVATQTITFNPINSRFLNEGNFAVVATGGASGNAVTFTSQTPLICTTSGTNGTAITVLRVGLCTIRANQAGNASYSAAPAVDRSLNIAESLPKVTVSIAPGSEGLGTITQMGVTELRLNTVLNLTVVANPRYVTRMSGTCGGSITSSTALVPQGAGSNNYRTDSIGADCTIIASFVAVKPAITISGSTTATAINATPTQTFSEVNTPATFTATLSGAIGVLNLYNTSSTPVFITFAADGVAIAGCEQQAITRTFVADETITRAACSTVSLSEGAKTITASFSGDNYNFPATTSTVPTASSPVQALRHVIIAVGAPPPPVVLPPVFVPPVVIPPIVVPPGTPPGSTTPTNVPVTLPPVTLTLRPMTAPAALPQTTSNAAAANGTVTPNGVGGANGAGGLLEVPLNATVDLAITANPHYLAQVSGTCGGRIITSTSLVPQGAGSNTYRTAEVGGECTVVINFVAALTTITVSGSNAITPVNATPSISTSEVDKPATFTATLRQAVGVVGLNQTSPSQVFVSFYADDILIAGCEQQLLTLAFGLDDSYYQASCNTQALSQGQHKITVSFSGDKYNFPAITDANKTPTPALTHIVQ